MLRSRRIALAATASSVVVAGALAALALTISAGSADAANAGSCTGQGSPVTCGWTSADPLTLTDPSSIGLWAESTPAGLPVQYAYDVTCTNSSGNTASASASVYQANGGLYTVTALPYTDPVSCSVVASATLPGTVLTGSAPSASPTTTATPTASPTPSRTSASMTFQVTYSSWTGSTASATPTTTATTSANQVRGYAGFCMDDTNNSSAIRNKIQIWRCNGGKAQSWTYSGSELRINGMCVNAKGNGKSGSKLILWQCTGAANEIFIHEGSEWVEKANNYKLCIDDPAFSTRGGTQLMVYTCNNGANQHWTEP
jgi:hypothetical protein